MRALSQTYFQAGPTLNRQQTLKTQRVVPKISPNAIIHMKRTE